MVNILVILRINTIRQNKKNEFETVDSGVASITQITHVRNKKRNIQGRSPYVLKVIFHAKGNCSSNEKGRS